jgi:signal transduction histidine kinase
MIYLVDPDQQQVFLAGTCRIDKNHVAVPETVALDSDSVWPFAEVIKTHQAKLISDLQVSFSSLPCGFWQRSPHQAIAVPIAPSGQTGKSGILIAGLNPFRLFDDNYRGFIDLVAAQIAASIANAQAYEEERKRAQALAEIDRAKTVFFSNISHEFRTPLTLMLGPLEETLINCATLLPANEREQLKMVQRNGLRLLKLVNSLLDFSRIEAGRVQASYEPTDLATFTAELASVFRSAVERAGMELSVSCPSLPAPVYVDRGMHSSSRWLEKLRSACSGHTIGLSSQSKIQESVSQQKKSPTFLSDFTASKGRKDALLRGQELDYHWCKNWYKCMAEQLK